MEGTSVCFGGKRDDRRTATLKDNPLIVTVAFRVLDRRRVDVCKTVAGAPRTQREKNAGTGKTQQRKTLGWRLNRQPSKG